MAKKDKDKDKVETDLERARRIIQEQNVQFLSMQFSDIVGHVKSVTIPADAFDDAVDHGVWFDGSSIEGFVRIAESDMYLVPDLATFAVIPWESGENVTARVICDVYTPAGEPFAGDPRHVLKRVMAEAEAMGFEYLTGPEPEFFLFRRDERGRPILETHDQAGYFDVPTDLGVDVRRQMVNALGAMGITVEAAHHEVAIGQHEIDFRYGNAVTTADNVVTLRVTVKAIAQQNGLYATFMPKPVAGINGSGMHVHQSLAQTKGNRNAFVDQKAEYGLSQLALQFVAGQLAHARGFAAVVAPTVNSYKRLVPGYEAPVYVSWARNNRSALLRVPRTSPGRPQSTRVELRCPDPVCQPLPGLRGDAGVGLGWHSARAHAPGAGRGGPVPPGPGPAGGQASSRCCPARWAMRWSRWSGTRWWPEALGDHVFARFVDAKRQEWDDYRLQVSPWEHERYFSTF